jgi:hypothetical protein
LIWFVRYTKISAMSDRVPPMPGEESFWYPHWRAMWEESLDNPTRTRISRAVRGGLAMSDPLEARFAVTLAYRDQGAWRWWPLFSLIYVGAGVTWLLLLSKVPMTAWTWAEWLLMGSNTLVVLTYAPLAHRRYRRAVIAEGLNRQVVASHQETTPS